MDWLIDCSEGTLYNNFIFKKESEMDACVQMLARVVAQPAFTELDVMFAITLI